MRLSDMPGRDHQDRKPVGLRTSPVHHWVPGSRHGMLGMGYGRRRLIG
jgi:hypothetical protein